MSFHSGSARAGIVVLVFALCCAFTGQAVAADISKREKSKGTDTRPKASDVHVQTTVNSIGMKLALVPAGEFMMGAEEDRIDLLNEFPYSQMKWIEDELPQHRVRITKPFYMGQYEVTLGQFLIFYHSAGYKAEVERSGKPSWGYKDGRLVESTSFRPWAPGWEISYDDPAIFISWNDAVAFCKWLSNKEGKTYRLPTEAEWEYACRAGTNSRYSFGNDPQELVYHANSSDQDRKALSPKAVIATLGGKDNKQSATIPFPYISRRDGYAWTSPVGKFRPNAFGLHDMQGNAFEWCLDRYDAHYYEHSPDNDPQGPATGSMRVLRGGAFNYNPVALRCADRNSDDPSHCDCSHGFRVVCEQELGVAQAK
ncbi:MAG TPA: formylglycine-generating enzyme family protein [Pirellulales bacterium]|jgi:formylglycine-generating enzyme required for sulfatase activity|nr:formylglycine-generating enzyme family protein [Pirellulales bacterium]